MQPGELRERIIDAIDIGELPGAESLCLALAAVDTGGEADYLLAVVRLQQGRLDESLALFAVAAAAQPGRADIAFNHGNALRRAGRLPSATAEWARASALDPTHVDARFNLAKATVESGDAASGAEHYRAVCRLRPEHADALFNLGNLLYRQREYEAAAATFAELLRHHQGLATGWVNYGMALRALGMDGDAETFYRMALTLDPGCATAHWNLAVLLLAHGRWREGLLEFEWRLNLPEAPKPKWTLPRWLPNGASGGRVVVWNDQGRGDAIQFLRYARDLAELGIHVIAYVQDDLQSLAASVPGVAEAVGFSQPLPAVGAELPLLSLPLALGLDEPGDWTGAYVGTTDGPASPPSGRIRVGVAWRGNPGHANDANRSMQLAEIAKLFAIEQIEWVSVQVGAGAEELGRVAGTERVRDLSPELGDFSDTAAFIRGLDLVISVDTAVAHLAGALEVPVWVLLPAVGTDWRWGLSGETTPWYPSMRLFRQTVPGQWDSVVETVKATLESVLPD